MCSLPMRISSSCLPSLFFWGHLLSSSLFGISQISIYWYQRRNVLHDLARPDDALYLIYQKRTDTHCETELVSYLFSRSFRSWHTLFANEGVIPVVGIICVSSRCTSSIAKDSEIKFCEQAISLSSIDIYTFLYGFSPRNSCPCRPWWPELEKG